MSACDFVIAAEGTKIGYPEVRRGLVAGLVLTFLRRQLRERDLRELLLTSELIDAKRAQEIGLVNRVVAPNELESAAQKFIASILQGAPTAVTNSKRLIEELWSSSVVDDVAARALSLPLYDGLTESDQEQVANVLKQTLGLREVSLAISSL